MKVFISYRRADSQWPADRIYEALKDVIPKSDIFLDIDKIPLGIDFRKYIDGRVAECDVLLALIGPSWLDIRGADASQRRLDDPDDFVRLEVASALARGIPVVPILLDGASMPEPSHLPPDLAELSSRNAVEVRRSTFEADVTRLVRGLAIPVSIIERQRARISRRAMAVIALLGWAQFTIAWLICGLILWSGLPLREQIYRTIAAFGMWDEYFDANSPLIEFVRWGALICLTWLAMLVSWKRLKLSFRTARIRWTIWSTVVAVWLFLGLWAWRDVPLPEGLYRTLASLLMWDAYFSSEGGIVTDHALEATGTIGSILTPLTLLFAFWDSIKASLAETFLER